MNSSHQLPIARKDGLVIQETPNEVLVYDLETNKAHCLNETAATIWKACNGVNSVTDISKSFAKPIPENLVWLAIDQLSDNNLLEKDLKSDFYGQSRREVIRKIGLAAVIALPVVSSLIAPTAVFAGACSTTVSGASGCANGGTPCPSTTSCTCTDNSAGTCSGGTLCIRNSDNQSC